VYYKLSRCIRTACKARVAKIITPLLVVVDRNICHSCSNIVECFLMSLNIEYMSAQGLPMLMQCLLQRIVHEIMWDDLSFEFDSVALLFDGIFCNFIQKTW